MKKWISLMMVLAVLLASCVSASAGWTAYVNGTADRVHLRQGPSANSNSMGLYFTGTAVDVLGSMSGQWTLISIGTETGYMMTKYLSSSYVTPRFPSAYVRVSSGSVNLRSSPYKANGNVIAKLYNGHWLEVHGETKSGWYYVYDGQHTGYMMSEFVSLGSSGGGGGGGYTPVQPTNAELYRSVLLDQSTFTNVDENRQMTLGDLLWSLGEASATGLAMADVDGDGLREALVSIGTDAYKLVLKTIGGKVYGTVLGYRAFNCPKRDGTFSFSSGASESGFGRLYIYQNYARTDAITQSYVDGSGVVRYLVNGYTSDQYAFDYAVNQQASKADLIWYAFSYENINSLID